MLQHRLKSFHRTSYAPLVALALCSACFGNQRAEPLTVDTDVGGVASNSSGSNATGSDASGSQTGGPDAGGPDVGVPVGTATAYVDVTATEAHGLATSQTCADCHTNDSSEAMRDAAGRAIGPLDLWESSMKANSARDPFFRAVLSAEVYRNPDHQAEIESTCLTCHAPMGKEAARRANTDITMAMATGQDDIGQLSGDGVSCVSCHGITPEGLGEEESFSGGWVLTSDSVLYGPHASPFTRPMEMHTGFTPTEGDHILESEHCATCHTLFTPSILPDGTIAEQLFPEQTPYLEWKNSSFSSGDSAQSCQDCHVPTTDADGGAISTYIARRPPGGTFGPTSPRSPYGRHLFVGGNTLIPAILRDNPVLKATASRAAFDATIAATIDQLQNRTAELELANVDLTADAATFDVRVRNLTGHKFPTAYPSRRAWLRVRVLGGDGGVLWASGEFSAEGDIVGVEGVQPHHDRITAATDVQVYQSVLATPEDDDTVALLHATRYSKDNRLLPRGFSADHPDYDDTAPVGTARDDDFVAGGDTVRYEVAVRSAARVEVTVLYQAVGNRWVRDLFEVPTPDVQAFKQMWERADRTPVTIRTAAWP